MCVCVTIVLSRVLISFLTDKISISYVSLLKYDQIFISVYLYAYIGIQVTKFLEKTAPVTHVCGRTNFAMHMKKFTSKISKKTVRAQRLTNNLAFHLIFVN